MARPDHAPGAGRPTGFAPRAFEPAVTFNGITYPHFHTGIDIAGPLDAPLHSAADGVVAIAGTEVDNQGRPVGYGNYVVIAHGGRMITLYGHLDQLLVHVGQVVHAGQVIGLEGSTGNSTGPHLHFELHVAGLLTDPAKYVRSQLATA
jgi:murein DD-endopeptidase MepM/ murein hydrolase activator NlpD